MIHRRRWSAGHALLSGAVEARTKVAPEHRHRYPAHIAEGLWRLESTRSDDIAAIVAAATETARYRREVMTLFADLYLEGFVLPQTPAVFQAADDALRRRSQCLWWRAGSGRSSPRFPNGARSSSSRIRAGC